MSAPVELALLRIGIPPLCTFLVFYCGVGGEDWFLLFHAWKSLASTPDLPGFTSADTSFRRRRNDDFLQSGSMRFLLFAGNCIRGFSVWGHLMRRIS